MIDLVQLLQTPYVNPETGIDLSPDGQLAAFSWNPSGEWEIYLLRLDEPGEPRQLTGGPGAKFGPRFSPDGTKLAYALDQDGSEAFDIYLFDLNNRKISNLTPDSPESIQPDFCWSPDGKAIAYLSDISGTFRTYIMQLPAGSGEPRLVYRSGGPHVRVRWSPDGKYLAVESESRGQDMNVGIIPLNGHFEPGEERLISQDGEVLNAWQTCWSPDGRRLAFSSDRSGRYEIGIYEPESAEITWCVSGGGDLGEPDWSPDGKKLACIKSDGPDTWLAVYDLESRAIERSQIEPGVHYWPKFTAHGRSVLLVFDNPRHPDDLWQYHLESRAFEQLTNSMPAELDPAAFVMPQHVCYPSPDGRSTPALLFKPVALDRQPVALDRSAPAVVVVHGGPSWLYQYLWYPLMAHMVSRGWVVLAPNYRGSTGYGREWQYANRFDLGHGDTMDVAAGVDFLIKKGLADPQRIAVTGRSHGGFLTMSCLTEYPERWAAGSAVVPFLNWFTSHANSRQDLQHWDIENMGDPVEYEQLWRERSPYFHLDRVTAPVQLISGANDPRCPASESIAARDRLRALGKDVELLLYPDEGHAFLKIENVIDHEVKRVEFLSRWLEG